VLIPVVEDGLERLLRATLPLPEDAGDVSFDPPSSAWSAQVNRLTVNLFLYHAGRSHQQSRGPQVRTAADGTTERRFALPVVDLGYLVSAWAGSPRDEHSLLGDVLTRLLAHQVLPPEHLSRAPSSPVQLSVAPDEHNRPRDLWAALGGSLRASFTLTVSLAVDAYGWETAPPAVAEVVPVTTRMGSR